MKSFATIAAPGLSIVVAKLSDESINSRERASSRAAIPVSFGARSLVTRSAGPPSSRSMRAAMARIENVADDRDCTSWRILHLRKIDADHASIRARSRHQDRKPSAGRTSQVDDSRAFAHQSVARNYFFNLECRSRWQSHRPRLAIEFVVRFVSRHESIRSLCRARRSRYLDGLRSEVLKLRRSL